MKTLSQLAHALQAETFGDAAVPIVGLSTDTRTLAPGELFVALKGLNFDGHDYVARARELGAAAALVERRLSVDMPQLVVDDARRALGTLGRLARAAFAGCVVGLTGSNGKTTLKEMCAAILSRCGTVLATRGNLNNDLGVPLTLWGLAGQDFAVIEMGANHPGEIAYLSALVRPQVAIVNNAGPCHLEGFGDLDGVARAKGEIFAALGPEGIAVINADDAYADYWRGLNRDRPVIDFGLDRPAAVSARIADAGRFVLRAPAGEIEIALALPGRHNVRNACAAAAAAAALGIGLEAVRAGLEGVAAVGGRLRAMPGRHASVIVDDAYNANPASLAAGIDALAGARERWLVLGDMAELGSTAVRLHAESGAYAAAHGIARLFALGPLSRHAAEAFGAGGEAYARIDDLLVALEAALAEGGQPTLLIKGSRSARMERVVAALALDDDSNRTLAGAHG